MIFQYIIIRTIDNHVVLIEYQVLLRGGIPQINCGTTLVCIVNHCNRIFIHT